MSTLGAVTAPTTVSNTSAAATAAPSGTLDKNAFLTLLVTQLKNQDPTNAQDPSQMVSQMATFSELEAQQNSNTLLASIQAQNAALYQAQSANLIGKSVQATSNNLTLSGGTATVDVNAASAGTGVMTIKNAAGQVVATIGPGSLAAGDNNITWDGKNNSGLQLPDGTYTVSVAAQTASGAAITTTTSTQAVVTAVSFVNGQVMVTAGGNQYSLANVTEISS